MFAFSFKISKFPRDAMYLPVTLLSVPWVTTKTDKCYRFSFNIFTAAVDGDGWARTKKAPSRLLAIQTSRSTYIGGENKAY